MSVKKNVKIHDHLFCDLQYLVVLNQGVVGFSSSNFVPIDAPSVVGHPGTPPIDG